MCLFISLELHFLSCFCKVSQMQNLSEQGESWAFDWSSWESCFGKFAATLNKSKDTRDHFLKKN